jgi:hypothetical protein
LNGNQEEQIRGLQFMAGLGQLLSHSDLMLRVFELCFSVDRNIQFRAVQVVCDSVLLMDPQGVLDRLVEVPPNWNGVVQILKVLQSLIRRGKHGDLWELFVRDVCHLKGSYRYLTLPSGMGDIPNHLLLTLWYQVVSTGEPLGQEIEQQMIVVLQQLATKDMDRKTCHSMIRLIQSMNPMVVSDLALQLLLSSDQLDRVCSFKEFQALISISMVCHDDEVYQWLLNSVSHSRWERKELGFETLGKHFIQNISISRLEQDGIMERAMEFFLEQIELVASRMPPP